MGDRGDKGMEIFQEDDNDVSVVGLKGCLDAGSTEPLLAAVKELLKRHRLRIIIDMSGVEFIDSAGVGILLASYRAADAEGGAMKICSIQHQVESVFSLTRLGEFFEIFDDTESAIKDFHRSHP